MLASTGAESAITLIATTIPLLDREEQGVAALAAALGTSAPPEWPPEFNGEAYRGWQRQLIQSAPEPGFAGYYVIANAELVGTAGFKGPPDADGTVEIGYSIIACRQRRGFATGAVRLLLALAFADPRVNRVAAETLADGVASQGVLAKAGFRPAGSRLDPEDGPVQRFERKR